MQNDIPFIEPTPELKKRECRLMAYGLEALLRGGTPVIGLTTWYLANWAYAIGFALLGFIVIGIVRAKMRNDSIPPKQQEYNYSDGSIAKWYVARRLLCEI